MGDSNAIGTQCDAGKMHAQVESHQCAVCMGSSDFCRNDC
jgi:hypothetical protein